jgi:signal transduction histidine kinase
VRGRGIRIRLLVANLLAIFAALGSVVVAVSFVGPGYFSAAMGHPPGDPNGAMMDAATLAAFGDAVRTALVVATAVGLCVAIVVSVAVSMPIAGPISRLAAAARRIAAGNYAERVTAAGPDEIGVLGQSFNVMAGSLEATERRRLQLVGDVAHELRTPLTTLDGYLEGLQDGVIAANTETWQLLRGETARLRLLVDDLQDLWRAEARQLPLKMEVVDAVPLVRSAVERWGPAAAERSVVLGLDLPPEAMPARLDRHRFGQIVDNYLSNAIRYSPTGSTVAIELARTGDSVVLAVRDQGVGLTPEQRDLLFERFYRVDPSRSRAAGGAGIGLAIVRALAEAMGGRAWADSDGPGRGSTFRVALPSGA